MAREIQHPEVTTENRAGRGRGLSVKKPTATMKRVLGCMTDGWTLILLTEQRPIVRLFSDGFRNFERVTYQTFNALVLAGLISARSDDPGKTVYQITDKGREALKQ